MTLIPVARRTLATLFLASRLAFPAAALAESATAGAPHASQVLVEADARLQTVRGQIVSLMDEGEIPSLSIAVAKSGRILWEESFGWADREAKTPATPHTIYPLASLSKSITATGVMVLVERGLVDLEAPAAHYLGGARMAVHEGDPDKLTVRTVLNMTAGIPHGSRSTFDAGEARPLATKDFLERHAFSAFPPGEVPHYSNISMAVADVIMETVSRKDIGSFMEADVFAPLGMKNTSAHIGPARLPRAATKYSAGGTRLPHSYFQPVGGGGYYSSAHDLLLYGMFHLKNRAHGQKRILSDESLDIMHTDVTQGEGAIFALGWGSNRLPDGRLWLVTNGGIQGACTTLSLLEGDDVAVVVLTSVSSDSRVTDEIATQITDALAPGFAATFETLKAKWETIYEPAGAFLPGNDLVGIWQGELVSGEQRMGIRFVIKPDGDVHVEPDRQLHCLGNDVSFHNDWFQGVYVGWIPTDDEMQGDNAIRFRFHVNDGRMTGFLSPTFPFDGGRYSLPVYCSLVKAEADLKTR